MPAVSLPQAANISYTRMYTRWLANTLVADLTAFLNAMVAIFPVDGSVNERTVSNWIVVGRNIQEQTAIAFDYEFFNDAVEMVYRTCLAGNDAVTATPARITAGQATAILAAYNATLF